MPDDDSSEAGSEVSSGTIRRGLQIIKEHAPKNVYRPSTRGHSIGRGRGHHEAAANAVAGLAVTSLVKLPRTPARFFNFYSLKTLHW